MMLQSFSGVIDTIGINPFVYLPDDILKKIFQQAGKNKGPIPVCGNLNGYSYNQTLIKYKGAWRLYINGAMRKAANVCSGDLVNVEIAYNPTPKRETVPKEFMIALSKNKKAKVIFENLTPYKKKEILRYLNSMKTEKSLMRNCTKVMQHLLGEKPVGLYALMHRNP